MQCTVLRFVCVLFWLCDAVRLEFGLTSPYSYHTVVRKCPDRRQAPNHQHRPLRFRNVVGAQRYTVAEHLLILIETGYEQ